MDITKIHTLSFAARIGQVAAADVFELLDDSPMFEVNPSLWFDLSLQAHPDESKRIVLSEEIVEKLGEYVCKHQVDAGERLYRHATGERLVASIGEWPSLTFEQRQPWETFTSTCRQAFNDLKAAQLAILDVRRAAQIVAPAPLAREDSIFEEQEDTFTMRPEAVEALKLSAIYERGQDAERQRLAHLADDRAQFNGADPAKFDHDGDGRPGGARKPAKPAAAVPQSAVDKAIARHARRKVVSKPAPLSVGEAPVKPPVNRGGRGKKKPAAPV